MKCKSYIICADATITIKAQSENDALSKAHFRNSGTWEISNEIVAGIDE